MLYCVFAYTFFGYTSWRCTHTQPRQIEVYVPQAGGGESLITRYLTPQQPPHGLDTVQKVVHFVRLVPFLEVCVCKYMYTLTYTCVCACMCVCMYVYGSIVLLLQVYAV
jgi:hypothetical protein